MSKKIRLLTSIASASFFFAPGEVVAVGDRIDEAEAERWIRAGIAQYEPGEAERAVVTIPERAVVGDKREGAPKRQRQAKEER